MRKLLYTGQKKLFWGCIDWQISISFESDLSFFIIEFFNKQTQLLNSFEVNDLCSCVQLMNIFAQGYNIAVFDRRLANWLSEYFSEVKYNIDDQTILQCLKNNADKKLDVKVKKLTDIRQDFTNQIQFNPADLEINFTDIYQKLPLINMHQTMIHFSKESIIPEELKPNFSIYTKSSYKLENKGHIFETINALKIGSDPSRLILEKKFKNTYDTTINNLILEDIITFDKKLVKLNAQLIAPDQSIISRFQPLDLITEEKDLKVVWKVDFLKIGHFIKLEYELRPRMLDLIIVQSNDQTSSFFRYNDIIIDLKNNSFSITLLNTHYIVEKEIINIESYLPLYFSLFQTHEEKKQFVKSIKKEKDFQIIRWNEKVIESLKSKSIVLSGHILPLNYDFLQNDIAWKEELLIPSKELLHSGSEPVTDSNKGLVYTDLKTIDDIREKESSQEMIIEKKVTQVSLEEEKNNSISTSIEDVTINTEKKKSVELNNQSTSLPGTFPQIEQLNLEKSINHKLLQKNDDKELIIGLNEKIISKIDTSELKEDKSSTVSKKNNSIAVENNTVLKSQDTIKNDDTKLDFLVETVQDSSTVKYKEIMETLPEKDITLQKLEKKSSFLEFIITSEDQKHLNDTSIKENQNILTEDFITIESYNDNDLEKYLHLPLRFWIRIPKKERFIIFLFNPHEMLSSHINGFWKENNQQQKFRLPIHRINGLWLVKIQFLVSEKHWEYYISYNTENLTNKF